ncbi:MAG: hypothetical protein AAGO57_05575 [Pseudomonadota bacterium]
MALFAILTAAAIGGDGDIACRFSSDDTKISPIEMTLSPVPSLKDRPGIYRVMMAVGEAKLRANAQPMIETADADVMVRAKASSGMTYTVGLRWDGAAAMYVARPGGGVTFTGWCQHHENWFPTWLGAEN